MEDRGSTTAVDSVLTVFVIAAIAILLPYLLTMAALGASAAPDDVGSLLILGFWSLVVVFIITVGGRAVGGGQ